MAVYRVDLLVRDYEPVFAWLEEHIPPTGLVRSVGYGVTHGRWVLKIVFKDKADADEFHRVWLPDQPPHDVRPWGSTR